MSGASAATTGGLTKTGSGTLTLSGANTYTGATTVSAGTLKAGVATVGVVSGAFGVGSAVTVASSGTLDLGGFDETIGSLAGSGTVTNSGVAKTLTAGNATSTTFSGIIKDGVGATNFTKAGTGTLTLSGTNTYTGTTTINTGTLQVSNSRALGTGNVAHNATLDIGSTTLNIGGNYIQGGAATLLVTVNGASSGSIVATGTCTVTATDRLILTVSSFAPNNTTYTIISGAAGGAVVAPVVTVNGGDSRTTFTATTNGNNLILTASRGTNGFAAAATPGDSNAEAVGTVLDNITDPSSDMTTVLTTLDGLSNSQVAASLDTMVPEIDAGVINTSTTSLNNFVGVSMDRVEEVMGIVGAADSASTGMSAGDEGKLSGIWGKGYGSFLSQGTRDGIYGYDAWNAGTAIGADHIIFNSFTVGVSGGYAYGNVDSDTNGANTVINSAQTTVYGGYSDQNLPYFIDAAGSFAYNWYNGTRNINIGNVIMRTANAAYEGQQYGLYMGGGYVFNLSKNIELTPLISLQYNRLHLGSYTETQAGALNLSVASQSYDQLQSGLGARIASSIPFTWGTLTPEAHGKWFYDFIGDAMTVTSTFNGGGGSFVSNGFNPARNSFNLGGQLILNFKNDFSIIGNCDTEIKDQFIGIYGSLTLRYDF